MDRQRSVGTQSGRTHAMRRYWMVVPCVLVVPIVLAAACTAGSTQRPPVPAGATSARADQSITIDGRSVGRRFDGVGGVSAGGSSRLLFDYPEPERSDILDYMFTPSYGAALQILKVEIGGDVNGTVGSEASHMRERGEVNCDRGYEWWLMKEARKRNPAIKLAGLQWGAPGWLDGGIWSPDNVTYHIKWLDCARQHGLKIDYMGGWNESGFNPAWFVMFDRALKAAYPDVQLIASDNAHTSHWNVVPAMLRDPAFNAATDIVGVHGPGGSRTDPDYVQVESDDAARNLGKPLWASELSSLAHDVGAAPLARVFNRSYIDARITGQMIWTPVSAWYPTLPIADTGPIVAEWPWSGYYDVGRSVWSLAHTTQFTEPGWHYLDTGSRRLESGATMVTLASPQGQDYTIVIEAMDVRVATTVAIQLMNLPAQALQLWVTDLASDDRADHFRHAATITPEGGLFRLELAPHHLYTISTKSSAGKGGARPTATVSAQLAVPFREDFEKLAATRLARFFSDVNGAFETAPCGGGRPGMCYRQAVARQPVEWHGPDMPPTTIAGDPRWWGDYRVSSDVLLESPGHVELLAHVDGVGGDEWVSGYHLRIAHDGAWRLYSEDIAGAEVALAAGRVPFGVGRWHNLALHFQGSEVRVLIDGTQTASVRDDRHRVGQIGLRTGRWIRAQFDNVQVTPTGAWPRFVPHAEITATATSAHATNAYGYTYPASAAIDDRPETYWRSEWEPPAPLPQAITLDLGTVRDVRALTYRPRISGHWAARYPGNAISRYVIALSTDGRDFAPVAAGSWRSSVAATRIATLDGEHRARYVRLEAMGHGLDCDASVTAGEINISTTPIADPSPDVPAIPAQFDSLVPRAQMTAVGTGGLAGHEPARAIDGDCATHWEPEPGQRPPRVITLDLGRSYDVSGLAYVPRQDEPLKGAITRYVVHVSSDGQTFTRVVGGDWANTPDRKYATWTPRAARYVRLDATGTAGAAGDPVAAGELHIGHGR